MLVIIVHLNTQNVRLYVIRPPFGTLANVAKILCNLWKEAEQLFLSNCEAQAGFAVDGNKSVFDKTLVSGNEFVKLLTTEKKLRKKQHNNKQESLKTRLDCLYSVMRFTAQIAAAEI